MDKHAISAASVSRTTAIRLIEAAIDTAMNGKFEASVAVVDAAGILKAFASTDHARFLTVDLAIGKAWTAASLGHPTHVWNSLTQDTLHASLANLPRVVPIGGGYPLFENGHLIGAIGASGGTTQQDQDAACLAIGMIGLDQPKQEKRPSRG